MTAPWPIAAPPLSDVDRAAQERAMHVLELRERAVPLLWADLERRRSGATASAGDDLVAVGLVGLAVGIAAGLRRGLR